MKNILITLAFFILIIFLPIKVSAEALPELSQAALEVIEGGMGDLIEAGASYKGLSPYTDGIIASYEILSEIIVQVGNIGEGSLALHTCTADDCVVRSLTSSEIDELENNSYVNFYNRNGDLVSYDDVYKVFYDNGYLSGSAYVDQYGDILYYEMGGNVLQRQAVNIIFGGNIVDWEDWNNFYELMSDNISANNGSYNFVNGVNLSDKSVWYLSLGGTYHGQPDWATSVIVQNCNLQGVSIVVPSGNNLSSATVFYNDGADIYIQYLLDQYTPPISNGDYYYNGFHYTHRMDFGGAYTRNENINDFYRWRYEGYDVYNRLFGIGEGNFLQVADLTYLPKKPYAFKLLQPPNGSEFPALDEGEAVDIDDLPEIITEPQTNPIPNPNYDPSSPIDPNNYPLYNPSNIPLIVSPSPLPYPVVSPVEPGLGTDIGQVTPEGLNTNIPIINDLRYRFPFSIPFDIHDMIQGLVVTREAPHFEWEIYLPIIDYTWEIDFDLSIWNSQAAIFRTCFLILFIIGLAYWAYNHFFGT